MQLTWLHFKQANLISAFVFQNDQSRANCFVICFRIHVSALSYDFEHHFESKPHGASWKIRANANASFPINGKALSCTVSHVRHLAVSHLAGAGAFTDILALILHRAA
uniref:Uncharacterized protein n=1 Tax=Anguilla anguilla TaxID=7936 RepID=A0A0E9X6T1_ANGAN